MKSNVFRRILKGLLLDALGVPCKYYRFPLWPHTMDIAKRVNDFSQKKMGDFFARYL